MMNAFNRTALLNEIGKLASTEREVRDILQATCVLLAERMPHYDWVGFYLVDPDAERELKLGPYVGAPTDHVRIPFGRGICGQAAERRETFVVDDVSKESNYLSCSIHVKSEIVVPLFDSAGALVGQIDIDSHTVGAFGEEDREFLEEVCGVLSGLF